MNKIRELRKAKGYSQKQLANILFVNQTAVSQWERGATTPSQNILLKLCDVFNVTSDYLLGRSESADIKIALSSEDESAEIPNKILQLAEKFKRLSPNRQDDILKILEVLVQQLESQDN